MFYTVCPNSSEDLNWCDWFVFGHEQEKMITEDTIRALFHEWLENGQECYENDPCWADAFGKFMEEKGYTVIKCDTLNWAISEL